MTQKPYLQIVYSFPCNDARLADLFEALDELHTAAAEGQLPAVTPMSKRELVAWLREVIYTAQETIAEIDQTTSRPEPVLRLVEKRSVKDEEARRDVNRMGAMEVSAS